MFTAEFEAKYLQQLYQLKATAKTPEQRSAALKCIEKIENKRPVVKYLTLDEIATSRK